MNVEKVFISSGLFYPSKLGGPANAVYWIAKALANNHLDVTVVTTHDSVDASVPADERVDMSGIKVFYCQNSSLIKKSFEEIKKADIVVLNSVCYKAEIILAIYSLLNSKKVIWSPRGEFSQSAIGGRLDKRIFFKVLKTFIADKIWFHATSDEEAKDIRNNLGQLTRIIRIPNYMELPERQEDSADEKPYFLFLGRIAPIKALDRIIEGFAKSDGFIKSPAILKIVGTNEAKYAEYGKALKDQVSCMGLNDKIKFLPPVFGDEKFKLLRSARFLVLLSESENFGNVVIESLSQGTPAITSKGTPWEILTETGAGYWVENSTEEISSTIDAAVGLSDDAYKEMRNNAYTLSRRYDIFENVGKWVDAFNTITE